MASPLKFFAFFLIAFSSAQALSKKDKSMDSFYNAFHTYLKNEINEANLIEDMSPYIRKLSIPETPAGGRLGYLRLMRAHRGFWDQGFKNHRQKLPNIVLKTLKEKRDSNADHPNLSTLPQQVVKAVSPGKLKPFSGGEEHVISLIISGIQRYEAAGEDTISELDAQIKEEEIKAGLRPGPRPKK